MAESKPTPDPTILSTEALARAVAAERDYIDSQLAIRDERLSGIDRATEVLSATVNKTPTVIQTEVSHLRELDEQKFESVALQFKERDVRADRESRNNEVNIDKAFAAQKESAAKQDEANQKSIDKSERSTVEAISKNAESATAANKALADKVDDLKDRVNRIESVGVGSKDAIHERREVTAGQLAIAGFVITLLFLGIALAGFLIGTGR